MESTPVADGGQQAQSGTGTPDGGSLRRLAIRGSAFEMLGYGAGQVLRLGSNLVLSRLLFPEAFGLSALVAIFMLGLV